MAYDKAVCHKRHTNADMAVHQCIKCNGWWATNAADGLAITRYCPVCVPLVFRHVLNDDQMARMYSDRLDARVVAAERADRLEHHTESLLHGKDSNVDDDTIPWPERYAELRQLGYLDWQIAKRFGISNLSLLRQLNRYGIPVRPEFAHMCAEDREQVRGRQSAS
jgi:hypothetical protein